MQNIPMSENISGYLGNVFGENFVASYCEYIQSEKQLFIRFSSLFCEKEKTIENLKKYNIELTPLDILPNVYKVEKGFENIGKTIEFTLGHYYIQSLSSMIPPLILNPGPEDTVLDLCSAPGSKTTQLAELMLNRGTLYANEPNLARIKGLVFNIDKMNFLNIGVIKQKGEVLSKFYEEHFDKVLVDAPCSGLGILQKKGEVSDWWNIKTAEKLAELQFKLLVSAIKMCKTDGEILYSTCTLSIEENELVLDKILNKYPVELLEIELPVKSVKALTEYNGVTLNQEIEKAHRIIPWDINSEGFFVAKLKKTGMTIPPVKAGFKKRDQEVYEAGHKNINKYLQQVSAHFGIPMEVLGRFKYYFKDKDIYFLDKDWKAPELSVFLRVGRRFGLVDKRDVCHLHTNSVQILKSYITENTEELDNLTELNTYLDGGTIKKQYDSYGQKIVKYNEILIGTAIALEDGLKSQFPRAMRTSDIVTPENDID